MAKSTSRAAASPFDCDKFDSIHQVGGIRTATYDYPDAGGSPGCRVAMVDTGSGLRFTVALDRGGDIVEATYNGQSLAYLTPNGYKPPSHAYHHETDWLTGWPGGLVTTCGPQYIGGPREEDGQTISLHGHHSNTPAALVGLHNPQPRKNDLQMSLDMIIRDTCMFSPVIEVRRRITATLGQPTIHIHDEVTNLGNLRTAHNWLYHVNLGYPLLDEGARLIYRGKTQVWPDSEKTHSTAALNRLKRVPGPLDAHRGNGERGAIVELPADKQGLAHVGLVNRKKNLAFELSFPVAQMPRAANWHHFGPAGSYVTGLEPFSGSLVGKNNDNHPAAAQYLEPGQTKSYDLTIAVHADRASIAELVKHDGDLVLSK